LKKGDAAGATEPLASRQKINCNPSGDQRQIREHLIYERDCFGHRFVCAQQAASCHIDSKKQDGDYDGSDLDRIEWGGLMNPVNGQPQVEPCRQPDQFVDGNGQHAVWLSRAAQPETGKKDEKEK
jgi:hypothetical protein